MIITSRSPNSRSARYGKTPADYIPLFLSGVFPCVVFGFRFYSTSFRLARNIRNHLRLAFASVHERVPSGEAITVRFIIGGRRF